MLNRKGWIGIAAAGTLSLGYGIGQYTTSEKLTSPPVAQAQPTAISAAATAVPPAEQLYVQIADRVMPSVANIYTTQQMRRRSRSWGPMPFWPGDQDPWSFPGQGSSAQVERPQSLGTGFVFEKDGNDALLLTNHHVIDDADQVYVKFTENAGEKRLKAEVIGRDPELDVALLRVKDAGDVRAVALGDSEALRVGEWVAALGNPFGHGHSMTHGIVSAKARTLPGGWGRYLQTDAPINPGNSGGPLVNLRGEVVGINNAIDARGPGIGFAIPVNAVKDVLESLRKDGHVERGYIGVSLASLAQTPIRDSGKYGPQHPVIAQVVPGEPAAKAGAQPFDIVTEINGQKVETVEDLMAAVTSVKVGAPIELKIDRSGKMAKLEMKAARRPTRDEG
jgi:serine protease Do